MIRILKGKSGVTLVELIVGMVIFALVALAVSIVITPILRTYDEANEYAELTSLADNLAAGILSDLSRSTVAPVIDDDIITITINSSVVEYTVGTADGLLRRNGSLVLSEPFYKNKTLALSEVDPPDDAEGSCYFFLLEICDSNGGTLLGKTYASKPVVLNQEPVAALKRGPLTPLSPLL